MGGNDSRGREILQAGSGREGFPRALPRGTEQGTAEDVLQSGALGDLPDMRKQDLDTGKHG